MSGGMPELGSKISLISKADIRYEGRLYTVDPQECTIALSSVRSFGTEDRETQFQIAPQSQIYDYILFRGSDIKDIRVVNNTLPHPNDPAIMQVQLPNGQHLMPHFPMPSMNAAHPPPMSTGSGYNNPFGALGGLGNIGTAPGTNGGGGAAASLAPGSGAPGPYMLGNQQQQQAQQKSQQQQKQPISVIDMLAGASRSTTPIDLISRKSPSVELGNQQQQQMHQQQQHHQHHQNQNNAGHGGNSRDAGHKRQNHQQRGANNQQRNNHNNNNNNSDYYHHPQQQQAHQQQQQHQQRDRRDSGRNMDNHSYNNHQQQQQQQQQHHDMRNNYNNQRNQSGGGGGGGQNRAWTMHRGGPPNANNMMRNHRGGAGGRGRMPNQGYRSMGGAPGGIGNQMKPRNSKNTIKFEQDFDFEQANNKFEELRSQLAKLKVGDEAKTTEQCTTPTPISQMNGETDKKDDSGNETGAGEHEPEDEEIHVGYDKTKSFFDNISCEAAQDRTKNKKNDWRQERKLNSETFGVSSTRRGSYRGRPNYYNRNVGNYTGGGYSRGYRGGNNYRNRSNNRTSGGGGGVNHTRDHSNTNANNNNNTGTALKQQSQNTGSAAAAAITAVATQASSKAMTTLQENNTQPQLAAVGQ